MSFHDVAFLSSQTIFSTLFLISCGRFSHLATAACLKPVFKVGDGILIE